MGGDRGRVPAAGVGKGTAHRCHRASFRRRKAHALGFQCSAELIDLRLNFVHLAKE